MSKQVNTGLRLYVTTDMPITQDILDYQLLNYTEVGEVLSIGEFGGAADEVQSQPLATGVTQFFGGFRQYGNPSLGLERDSSDAGQAILQTALSTKQPSTMRLQLADGENIYLNARIFSFSNTIGSANSMIGSTVNVRVNEKPVAGETVDLFNPFVSGGAIYNYGFLSAASELWS